MRRVHQGPRSESTSATRLELPNTLRVLLSRDSSAPVVAVSTVHSAGVRAELPGQAAYAHLFEHLLFEGGICGEEPGPSAILARGGICNAGTTPDFSSYYAVLPANDLETALAHAAARLRKQTFTEQMVARQVRVVREEVREAMSHPHGGFPWVWLPELMFSSYADSHDGFSYLGDIERVTAEELQAFHEANYTSAASVLSVVGDFDEDTCWTIIQRHFDEEPRKTYPPVTRTAHLRDVGRMVREDPLARQPAVSLSWHTPDPSHLAEHLPFVVLFECLAGRQDSLLPRRLTGMNPFLSQVSGMLGLTGELCEARGPAPFVVYGYSVRPDRSVRQIEQAIHREIGAIAANGPEASDLATAIRSLNARTYRELDPAVNRALAFGIRELQYGRPELTYELPGLISQIRATEVAAAARTLTEESSYVLEAYPQAIPLSGTHQPL